ncbi:Gfo/Idh/MocA family protein [Curtobacterium sp. NPDC090217]|uniref:Gfo/Idh/MocA family protein n=1 Tax=Curtobacterium sp. NPDC090217 TaxID=3363970 RepID=UPI0038119284
MSGITVAVVGLGFGQDFVPIYLAHPAVAEVVLVEPDPARAAEVAQRFGVRRVLHGFEEALADPSIDAVHVLAPVVFHAEMTVAALDAGKHVACAVPMATTLEDLDRIIDAADRSGRRYMMMETSVHGREYLTVESMFRAGEFGSPTLYRGFHVQNLDGFPSYWLGFPPMHYVTHALSPALALFDTTVASVRANGSGRLTPDHARGGFDNPFPVEVGTFLLRGTDVVADVVMSFFQTGRSYIEGFSLYGERRGVEWPADNEGPLTVHDMLPSDGVHRGNRVTTRLHEPADHGHLLPPPLAPFVRPTTVRFPGMTEPVTVADGHGGSHPFLVHEFVSAIVEDRPSRIDERIAAAWTAPGICAHQSALHDGELVPVPDYTAPGREARGGPDPSLRSA